MSDPVPGIAPEKWPSGLSSLPDSEDRSGTQDMITFSNGSTLGPHLDVKPISDSRRLWNR